MSTSSVPRTSFADLMAVEAVSSGGATKCSNGNANVTDEIYMSVRRGWSPTGTGATYGGHVYAQAVWAAAQTVDEGLVVHNVHGYFTLPGLPDRPFVYSISHTSEGRSYCTRRVEVRQPLGKSNSGKEFNANDAGQPMGKICFTCICSFKRDEPSDWGHQETKDWKEKYNMVLEGRRPTDYEIAPTVDAPWYHEYSSQNPKPNTFPGLEIRKVHMRPYNTPLNPSSYRQLSYYSVLGQIPPRATNLHACAHLYASDRNSLFLISNALGFPNHVAKMGSLSHSVVFHVPSTGLLIHPVGENPSNGGGADGDDDDDAKWFCQEAWTPQSGGGRGMHESRIWAADGTHVASTWQDGLLRRAEESPAQMEGHFQRLKKKDAGKEAQKEIEGKSRL